MSTRRPILFPAICLALAVFCAATAQPLQPEGDNEFGGTPGMHLFLQSRFIRTHQADRLHFARMRHYREGYLDAVGHGEYARALAFSDSLIRTAEHHPVAGVHFTDCYKERADMFRRLHRDSEACMAYARAVKVRDSLLRLEQSKVIREKQESYELDRMALDAALLTAHHHKTALAYVSLALLVIAAVVGAIYVGNRRTRRLQKELLLQTKHAHESELKKAAFVNSVCHEVRTPLNCIMGFSELLCAEEITPEGVWCTDANGERHLVEGTTVICALGQRARTDVVEQLRNTAPFVRVIGDARRVSTITNAVYQGYHAALDI